MKEEWKDIKGFEGRYMVSNTGKVKSCDRVVKRGDNKLTVNERILKPQKNSMGYYRVGLMKGNIRTRKFVHRIVAKAFIPNPENKPNINHIDFDTENNKASNLEWCSQKENIKHSRDNGNYPETNPMPGEQNPSSILTKEEVLELRALWPQGWFTRRELSNVYSVSMGTIKSVVTYRSWNHV